MERRSGYKECPRCGLRNKPSVAQCDFCGWQFEESQDEWIDQIRALEKISTDEGTVAVDEELSKRIEATIIKPDEVSVDDFVGEEDRSFAAPSESVPQSHSISTPPTPEERKETLEATSQKLLGPELEQTSVVVSEPETPMTRAEVESAEVAEFVESMIEEVGVEEIKELEGPTPVPIPEEAMPEIPEAPAAPQEKKVVEKPAVPESIPAAFDFGPMAVPAAIFGAGAAAYSGILLFSILQPVNWMIGWTMSIAGAILMTVGCGRLYDAWKRPAVPREDLGTGSVEPKVTQDEKGVEVFICPLCNEVVSENDDHCPNCGAEFEREKS